MPQANRSFSKQDQQTLLDAQNVLRRHGYFLLSEEVAHVTPSAELTPEMIEKLVNGFRKYGRITATTKGGRTGDKFVVSSMKTFRSRSRRGRAVGRLNKKA